MWAYSLTWESEETALRHNILILKLAPRLQEHTHVCVCVWGGQNGLREYSMGGVETRTHADRETVRRDGGGRVAAFAPGFDPTSQFTTASSFRGFIAAGSWGGSAQTCSCPVGLWFCHKLVQKKMEHPAHVEKNKGQWISWSLSSLMCSFLIKA